MNKSQIIVSSVAPTEDDEDVKDDNKSPNSKIKDLK